MNYNQIQFCKIYTQFYGESISVPKQVTHFKQTGDELQQFCEFYYKERMDKSGLKHFYTCKKQEHIAIGVLIGVAISLVTFLIVF